MEANVVPLARPQALETASMVHTAQELGPFEIMK
jgi:hypothetical protein